MHTCPFLSPACIQEISPSLAHTYTWNYCVFFPLTFDGVNLNVCKGWDASLACTLFLFLLRIKYCFFRAVVDAKGFWCSFGSLTIDRVVLSSPLCINVHKNAYKESHASALEGRLTIHMRHVSCETASARVIILTIKQDESQIVVIFWL